MATQPVFPLESGRAMLQSRMGNVNIDLTQLYLIPHTKFVKIDILHKQARKKRDAIRELKLAI